jgi:iron complex outermembrane receptor protein
VGGVFVQPGTCNTGPNIGLVAGFADCHDDYKAKFSYPSWTAGLDYRLTDQVFVYAKTSGASLAGGFNNRTAPPGTAAFNPEHVHDVETGFKGDFLDHKLRTNVAVFYEWRDGVQNIVVDYIPGIGSTQYVRNAGNVRSYGGEFEGTLLPWHGMEIIGNVAYLHSRYEKGSFIAEGIDGIVDHSNEVVQQAPKWTWSIGATQTFDTSLGKLSFHADYAYVSDRAYYADTPDLTDPTLTAAAKQALIAEYAASNKLSIIKGYGLLNGRVALEMEHPNLEIALWARNLAGKHYFTNEFPTYTGLGYIIKYRGDPRTFGATATFRF